MSTTRPLSPRPDDEAARQAALDALQIADSTDPVLDAITGLAALICQTPMSIVTLLDRASARTMSAYGIAQGASDREDSFCAHTIMDPDSVMLVPDARRDPIFHTYPAVQGEVGLRSYAGVPLVTPDGHALGALCVFDSEPHQFTSTQQECLRLLGRLAQLRLTE